MRRSDFYKSSINNRQYSIFNCDNRRHYYFNDLATDYSVFTQSYVLMNFCKKSNSPSKMINS